MEGMGTLKHGECGLGTSCTCLASPWVRFLCRHMICVSFCCSHPHMSHALHCDIPPLLHSLFFLYAWWGYKLKNREGNLHVHHSIFWHWVGWSRGISSLLVVPVLKIQILNDHLHVLHQLIATLISLFFKCIYLCMWMHGWVLGWL